MREKTILIRFILWSVFAQSYKIYPKCDKSDLELPENAKEWRCDFLKTGLKCGLICQDNYRLVQSKKLLTFIHGFLGLAPSVNSGKNPWKIKTISASRVSAGLSYDANFKWHMPIWEEICRAEQKYMPFFWDRHRACFPGKKPKHGNIYKLMPRYALDFFSGKHARSRSQKMAYIFVQHGISSLILAYAIWN